MIMIRLWCPTTTTTIATMLKMDVRMTSGWLAPQIKKNSWRAGWTSLTVWWNISINSCQYIQQYVKIQAIMSRKDDDWWHFKIQAIAPSSLCHHQTFGHHLLAHVVINVLARVVLHVLARVLLHVLVWCSMVLARVVIHVLARVLPHVLARVLLHVLARVIIHVHDYYSKTCIPDTRMQQLKAPCHSSSNMAIYFWNFTVSTIGQW